MKILQVITSLRLGGAEKVVAELALRLPAFGHTVDVAVFDGMNTPLKEQLEQKGVKVYALGQGTYNPIYVFGLMRLMKDYDLVHTHNTSPQLYTALANLFCKKMMLTTEHSPSNRRRGKKLFEWVDRWMYKQYDSVACITERARDNLLQHIGATKASVSVIPNGIDVHLFHSAKPLSALRKRSGNRFIVTMVAGFRAEKDQDTVIKALALLPRDRFELWLVGDGVRSDVLHQLVDEFGVTDIVRFLGWRSDIPEVLHTSDAIIMSSHYEGLSLSSLEGMCVGKPFIASDVAGLHEIVQGAGLLFPHQDAQALADILMMLEGSPEQCKDVATQCLERAEKYDVNNMVTAYSQLYKNIRK